MGLFDKKSLLDKLLQSFNSLSDEDKEKFKESIVSRETENEAETDEKPEQEVESETSSQPEEKSEEAEVQEPESEEIKEPLEEESEMQEETAESTPVEETSIEESAEEETENIEKAEDLQNGMEARLKALEEKLETILAEKEDSKPKDFGVSGFGKSETENLETDNRNEEIIKKLGGRAR